MMSGSRDEGRAVPASELGRTVPVSELEVLAAVSRAERHETRGATVGTVSNHLGWRYSGASTARLRPHLRRLVEAGLLTTVSPPHHKSRTQIWSTTAAGRRKLSASATVELPESPQHRRWRQDRDVALWALDGVRAEGRAVVDQAYDLLYDQRVEEPITDEEISALRRRFDRAMEALAVAIRMSERWPEPDDLQADPESKGVLLLLPENARVRRRK